MRSSEWVAFVYFLYLAGVCWLRPLPASRRLRVTSASAVLAAAIGLLAAIAPSAVRDWMPFLYVSAGYYLTGRLFVKPSERLEAWLLEWDRKLLGDPATRFLNWPGWLITYLEIVYVICFLLLPGGFAALALSGRSALADHYWTMVIAADFAAFAPLSVFQTRPPWALEPKPVLAGRSVHRLAGYMVRHATIGANTFPSGHVAVSFAVAMAVIGSMPLAGAVLLVLAVSISVACVVGRYHYAVDVAAGAVVAAVVYAVVMIFGI